VDSLILEVDGERSSSLSFSGSGSVVSRISCRIVVQYIANVLVAIAFLETKNILCERRQWASKARFLLSGFNNGDFYMLAMAGGLDFRAFNYLVAAWLARDNTWFTH
jgi:hypothetical protein